MTRVSSLAFPGITPNSKIRHSQIPMYGDFKGAVRVFKQQKKPAPREPPVRHCCDVTQCTATFARSYDLIRHKRTVHGPKLQCPYSHCGYATARGDKMREHEKKKHQTFHGHCHLKVPFDAPVGFEYNNLPCCRCFVTGPEMNGCWPGETNLVAWPGSGWNPYWTMTAQAAQ